MSSPGSPANPIRRETASNEPSALQRAITALEKMKARLDAVERAANEPIAIVGMGCRFPGGGEGLEAFWRVLDNGTDAIGEISPNRWPADAISGERQEARWAALLDDLSTFDASFFGISPREAASLDPQQRMLLEVTWEALEDAGLRPDLLSGSRTGVLVGICGNDYQQLVGEYRAGQYDVYCATGNMFSTAAGRISFALGLNGPAVSIDTACSSSLVAIAQACQTLRAGDADTVVAGGVNAILAPRMMAMLLQTQALSPDGRCKALDARANGFVRGEGCGLVVLKRVSDALRDGDRIRALIRGWAVNQDGRSTGLTTPNVLSQQSMLRDALARAQLAPADIGYVEMHGTGTSLGDPIEAEALREVFGAPRSDGSSCILGAVKTNIGHLEGASGVAGIIKVLLALEHEQIPKNLHFRKLNPRISFDGTPFVIPREAASWPRGAKPRRAGVSAFGISGTNAHVILEEAPAEKTRMPAKDASAYLLPLSAKTPHALSALAKAYAEWFSARRDVPLQDVVFTASARRTHHEHRVAIVARTHEEFAHAAGSFARNETPAGVVQGRTTSQGAPRIVFVFSGQGSQWAGMGKTLFENEPIFRAKVEEIGALVRRHASFSLLDELVAPENQSRLGETEIVQPALFALQVGLAELFKSWGIVPNAVIGHSVGEVAAAHVCGFLSLEDSVRLVVLRGRIMQQGTGNGKMVWVALSAAEATKVLAGRQNQLSVAAVNDPASAVLSGETASLDALMAELTARGVPTRPLRVNYAFHSPQMAPLSRAFVNELGRIETKPNAVPMYSTVSGDRIDGKNLDAAYWGTNIRATVNLAGAVDAVLRDGYRGLVEMAPHPVLLTNLAQCASEAKIDAVVVPTLRRQTDERRALLETLGALHVTGLEIDWEKLYPEGGRVASLPTYPWQKERFWIEPPRRTNAAGGKGVHPLLGIRFDSSIAPGEYAWQQTLSSEAFPYLADHRVQGAVVFPGAGYVEMALSATSAVYGAGVVVIEEMSLDQILALNPNAERQVQVVLQKDDEGFAGIGISSRGEGEESWTRHSTIRVHVETTTRPASEALRAIEERCSQLVDTNAHYAHMDARAMFYGETFRGVQEVRMREGEVLGRIALPESAALHVSEYSVHPALLDACLQAASWALASRIGDSSFVPRGFVDVRYYGRPARQVWVHGRLRESTDSDVPSIGIVVYDDTGRPLIEIGEMRVALFDGKISPTATDPFDDWLFDVAWRQKDLPAKATAIAQTVGAWLVLADSHGVGRAIATSLRERGEACIEAFAGSTYQVAADGECLFDPTSSIHIRRLLGETFGPQRQCKGVVHLLSLDATPWESTTPETLSNDLRQTCVSALHLTQALMVQGWRDVPRLYLVTRAVHSIEPHDVSVAVSQAPLWGLGRTIALEHPALECTRLDLSRMSSPDEVEKIALELLSGDVEDQVALRPSGRFVARLARRAIAAAPPCDFAFRSDHTYLITGGLGGLGLEMAYWMVEQGVRHLVLVGRKEPGQRAIEAIERMEQAGAKVRVVPADVSHRDEVASVLSLQQRELPPLAGIVHAAAVLEDRTLLDLSEETFLRVMGAKVFGAFHLHELTANHPLDFFLLYSSVAGVLGSPGQGNYAAANAFVDAFARARTAMGLPAMSIAWGPFTDVGLAAAQENRGKRIASRGLEGITAATGNAIVDKLLHRPRAEVAVMRLSVTQWQESYPQAASLPLLAELRANAALAEATRDGAQPFQQLLASTEASRRSQLVQAHTLEQLGRVLHLDSARIDPSATFTSLGVDSLMSLELRNRLQASLGIHLQATLLFVYPTPDKLVAHIVDKLDLGQPAEATSALQTNPPPEEKPAQTDQLHEMGVDDLMALLDEELSATKKGN